MIKENKNSTTYNCRTIQIEKAYDNQLYLTKATLGTLLQRTRTRSGLTQSEVSHKLRITIRLICEIENGNTVSANILHLVFCFYLYKGNVTPADSRSFSYFFSKMWRF